MVPILGNKMWFGCENFNILPLLMPSQVCDISESLGETASVGLP